MHGRSGKLDGRGRNIVCVADRCRSAGVGGPVDGNAAGQPGLCLLRTGEEAVYSTAELLHLHAGQRDDSKCTFNDVAQGDNDVACVGTFNCYAPGAIAGGFPTIYGVLSLTDKSYSKAYNSTEQWDFATGIGTLNVSNLVANWNTAF